METILIGLYIACELIANVTASKRIQLGGIVVPAAIFIYPLTFTLIDLINESLVKQGARKMIWAAFMANLLLAAHSHLAVVLPTPYGLGHLNIGIYDLLTAKSVSFFSYRLKLELK